jgi:hypothetical protein
LALAMQRVEKTPAYKVFPCCRPNSRAQRTALAVFSRAEVVDEESGDCGSSPSNIFFAHHQLDCGALRGDLTVGCPGQTKRRGDVGVDWPGHTSTKIWRSLDRPISAASKRPLNPPQQSCSHKHPYARLRAQYACQQSYSHLGPAAIRRTGLWPDVPEEPSPVPTVKIASLVCWPNSQCHIYIHDSFHALIFPPPSKPCP